MEHSLAILSEISFAIIAATISAHALKLLKQPFILGYILGGIILGKHGLGLITNEINIEIISEMGLIFLLFIIGQEINIRELARVGKTVFITGIVQFIGCASLAYALFLPFAGNLGESRFALLYISIGLALSSTLIVVKLLQDKFETSTAAGRLTIGILVLQDIWAIIFMAFQPNLQDPNLWKLLKSFLLGAGVVTLSFAFSKYILSFIFARIAKSPELVLLTAIAWCFLVSGLSEKAGLSKEMGALIAGISISAFPYGADIISKLSGIRDFFITLFFVALGLKFTKPDAQTLFLSIYALPVVLITRCITIIPITYILKQGVRTGTVASVNLSQISEFSLVIFALGAGYGHIVQKTQNIILTSMMITSVAATYLILYNDSIGRLITSVLAKLGIHDKQHKDADSGKSADIEKRDIFMLGCFREGMALINTIVSKSPELAKRMVIVDFKPELRHKFETLGFKFVYADLAHFETLHHFGIEKAEIVICPVSDTFLKGTSNSKLLYHIRKFAPNSRIILTADNPQQAQDLISAGADDILMVSELAGNKLFEMLTK